MGYNRFKLIIDVRITICIVMNHLITHRIKQLGFANLNRYYYPCGNTMLAFLESFA